MSILCIFVHSASEELYRYPPYRITWLSPLGGYEAGKEYQLLRDAFIMVVDDDMEGKRLALCPEGIFEKRARYHSVPHTVEAYQKNPEQAVIMKHKYGSYRINVDGIVYAGTKIKCTRVRQHRGINGWSGTHNQITVYAKILDGKQQGKEVDLGDVSDHYETKKVWLFSPDRQLLKSL